jgi:hypothetical protein
MPRSRWRRVVGLLGCLALVGIWAISAYQLLAGQVIDAQVLSCGSGPRPSCEVAWSYRSTHGITNVEGDGYTPGRLMPVYYTPGFGVTPRDSAVIVTFLVPAVVCLGIGSVLWRRRFRAVTY